MQPFTTVACVWVRGHINFTLEYVERLKWMVDRRIDRPYWFVCLTDRPQREMPKGVEAIPVEHPANLKGWWSKIHLWDGRLTGRVVYFDLDVLLVAPIAPIIDYPARIAFVPDGAPNFKGNGGRHVVKRYNSSVAVWDAGVGQEIFDDFKPSVAQRLWGDQDWIGERLPNEATMPLEWFPRISAVQPPWPREAKVILCKKPKNLDAMKQWDWFDKEWR